MRIKSYTCLEDTSMAPRRAKHPALEVSYEDSTQNRRSSLQVNLSYVSNLSDSGNGSLRLTQPENNSRNAEKSTIILKRSLVPNMAGNSKSRLKDANLSAMRERESALSQSCEFLKNAIMSKTREIFQGNAELAVKTANVLNGERQALKEINEDCARKNERIMSNNITVRKYVSGEKKASGPLKRNLRSALRISSDGNSPILSGSQKSRGNSPNLGKKELRVRLIRLTDPRLDTSVESSRSSSSDIGAPITCSSFIAGHDEPKSQLAENRDNGNNNDHTSVEAATTLSPMEITAIQGQIKSAKKPSFANDNRSDIAIKRKETFDNHETSIEEAVSMELTNVQGHIHPRDLSSNENNNRTSLNVNTSVSSADIRNSINSMNNHNTSDDSSPKISLRVNTSLENEQDESMENPNDRDSAFVDKGPERSLAKKSKNREIISDSDSVEEMSLIARLRNVSEKKKDCERSIAGEGPSFVEGTPYPPSRSMLWKSQIRSETINARKNRRVLNLQDSTGRSKNRSKDSECDSAASEECITTPNKTVIIGDSPLRVACSTTNPRIIEDSSGNDEPSKSVGTTIPNESTTSNGPKTGKKKLLPFVDNSVIVSFSPVSAEPTPKKPLTWKPRKQFRKRRSTRAVAEKRIEESRRDDDDEDDEDADDELPRSNILKVKNTKIKRPRKVVSKKIVVKKIVGHELLDKLDDAGRTSSEQSISYGRNSMNEFTRKKKITINGRNSKPQKLSIVPTGFCKGDVDLVKSVVKELGGAEICTTVSRRTTHVVSTGVRTINLLRGIIRGCWMVNLEWALKSLEKKKWLDPERYELVHFSKAVQENRRDRQIFGKAYVPELFTTCGSIHIEHGTSPPPEILKELVKTAGGRIAEYPRDARLIVGPGGLREIWIMDSITTGDLQPIDEYRRQ